MKHLGDITLIKGNEVPVVDCVIGGSPCQDLSLAGKRAGLAGERSGLYMEQIRIIKEMRANDRRNGRSGVDVRPRYMVWENVPGAFSSNGGKDFAAVLEEAIRVAEPEAPAVRVPEKGWPTSGCFWDELGRWSVAWRVLDAQFWGTSDKPLPQRRRRIALVADFGGLSAPEILFVRQSVSGNIEPGKPKGKETAGDAGEGSCRPSYGIQGSMIGRSDKNGPQGDGVNDDQGGSQISVRRDGKCPTLRAEMHGNIPAVIEPVVYDARGNGDGKIASTITGDHQNRVTDYTSVVMEPVCFEMQAFGKYKDSGIASSLKARDCKDATDLVAQYIDTSHADDVVRVDDVTAPLQARDYKGGGNWSCDTSSED